MFSLFFWHWPTKNIGIIERNNLLTKFKLSYLVWTKIECFSQTNFNCSIFFLPFYFILFYFIYVFLNFTKKYKSIRHQIHDLGNLSRIEVIVGLEWGFSIQHVVIISWRNSSDCFPFSILSNLFPVLFFF